LNPGLLGERPATNRLRHGTALVFVTYGLYENIFYGKSRRYVLDNSTTKTHELGLAIKSVAVCVMKAKWAKR
jgi:hypothetical protein